MIRFSRTLRIALIAAASLALLVGLYAAAGYWLAPRLLRDALIETVRDDLGHRLELRAVRIDPWRLTLALEGASLRTREGALLGGFERLAADLEPASLWEDGWRLRTVVLVAPRLEVTRDAGGALNWAGLLAAPGRGAGTPVPRIGIGRAALQRGEIAYEDRTVPGSARLRVSQLALEVRGFSTAAGAAAPVTLSAQLDDGARLDAKGTFGWDPRSAAGELALENFPLATLARLAGAPLRATGGTVRASGRFALRGEASSLLLEDLQLAVAEFALELAGGKASAGALSAAGGRYAAVDGALRFGRAQIDDAALAGAGEPVAGVRLAQLALEGIVLSPAQRSLAIEQASLRGLEGSDTLDAQGASRLAAIVAPPAQAAAAPAAPAASEPWRVTLRQLEAQDSAWRIAQPGPAGAGAQFARISIAEAQLAAGPAPAFSAARVQASGGVLRHEADAHTTELREVDLSVSGLRYPQGDPVAAEAQFALAQGGRVSAKGKLDIGARSATFALRAEALPLALAQPWVEPHLALRIAAGALSADGRLRLATQPATAAEFRGRLALRGLDLREAASGATLFGAEAIEARGAELALAPVSVTISEVTLQAPAGRLVIAEDGTLNLAGLRTAKPGSGPAESADLRLALGSVSMKDGRLDFADRSLAPAFAVRIDELAGTVRGVGGATPAEVALEGRVDEYGAASIRGALDPFAPGSRTDLTLAVRNLEMSALDPYVQRFAGYRIAAGKLGGELRYRVREGKLEGQNRLVFEKLTLGERVASAEAADLPLELGIALLTDSEGRIQIEIPVRGDLDRPEFDFGQVISQAIGNALGKIVSAPFRLLAGMFGQEETIDRIVFAPGSARLAPPEREKIVTIARALEARPLLALRVAGTFDARRDADGLRAAKVEVDAAALSGLARARAEAVREALLAQGIAASRVELASSTVADDEDKLGVPTALSLKER